MNSWERDDPISWKSSDPATSEYVIEKKLADSALEALYKAKRRHDKKSVIITHVKCFDDGANEFLEKVRCLVHMEAHTNVVTVEDAFVHGGELYIVLEAFHPDHTLKSLIEKARTRRQNLTDATLWKICYQIASGLSYLHVKLTHSYQAMTPKSVTVSSSGKVKLIPFCVEYPASWARIGTKYLRYVSPEVIRGEPLTMQTDIFDFGCAMYQLVTLEEPFEHQTNQTLLKALLASAYKPLKSDVSTVVRDLIQRCLDADPDGRPTARQVYKVTKRMVEKHLMLSPSSAFAMVHTISTNCLYSANAEPQEEFFVRVVSRLPPELQVHVAGFLRDCSDVTPSKEELVRECAKITVTMTAKDAAVYNAVVARSVAVSAWESVYGPLCEGSGDRVHVRRQLRQLRFLIEHCCSMHGRGAVCMDNTMPTPEVTRSRLAATAHRNVARSSPHLRGADETVDIPPLLSPRIRKAITLLLVKRLSSDKARGAEVMDYVSNTDIENILGLLVAGSAKKRSAWLVHPPRQWSAQT